MTASSPIQRIREHQAKALQQGARHIGDVIAYEGTAMRVPRKDLKQVFESRGFKDVVTETIDLKTALSRAVSRPLPKGVFAKPFEKRQDDAVYSIGVYVQVAGEGEKGDRMLCGARIRVERTGRIVALPPEGADSIPECLETAERIAASAIDLVHFAETADVTAALVHVVTEKFRGVALRRRGGIYFVRPDYSDTWRELSAALGIYGLIDLSYPMVAMPDDQRAVSSTAHAVKASLESELADLRQELESLDEKTRDKTIDRRVSDCEAVVAKAELYGEILGGWVEELKRAADRTKEAFRTKTALDADDLFAPLGGSEA